MNRTEILQRFDLIARRRIALSTERSYRSWILKYLKFLVTPQARVCGTSEEKMESFLSRMAHAEYSAVSQNQAFNALLFFYRHVVKVEIGDVSALRCRRGFRERYVPTQAEISAMFSKLTNTPTYNVRLLAALLYGCGLRVKSACELRIKDFDLDRMVLTIHEDKGDKDRQVTIPTILLPALRRQLARASALAEVDVAARQPVQLPGRLDVKYPKREFEVRWHFLFPSPMPCSHPRTGKIVRWRVGEDVIQRAIKRASEAAGIPGKVTPHCLRHAYCSDLMDAGHSPRRVQEAMGHSDIRTTMGYARKECLSLPSPLESLRSHT
ncbi:site-specific recombinase XerD [Haloferula luteola]|uniref:Site-specific recombinase XerD n=1 Tax=Haloferula luteola TaxID=595692 RepID=A0A840V8P8_9BACT|nr:tyrosine-type recombinase/integrase [Haloferula luteola]MBB5351098.1 site-specific recombinase XerD [Haloferula luteola]